MSATTPTTPNGSAAPTGAAVPSFGFAEAPASINVRVLSPAGFDYQLTMRANRVGDVLNQAQELERWLLKHDWTPAPTYRNGNAPAAPASPVTNGQGNGQAQAEAEPAICDQCGRPMKQKPRRDGKGFFWSCETKYGSEWCKGRPRK